MNLRKFVGAVAPLILVPLANNKEIQEYLRGYFELSKKNGKNKENKKQKGDSGISGGYFELSKKKIYPI